MAASAAKGEKSGAASLDAGVVSGNKYALRRARTWIVASLIAATYVAFVAARSVASRMI
jgi:hypothetical protein